MRKFLIPALATALVMGLVIAGTWAVFGDAETSSGNTFAAGTLDLEIRDQNEDWGDGPVSATWTMSNMKPGDELTGTLEFVGLRLKGASTLPGSSIDIAVSNTIIDPPGPESDTEDLTTTDMDEVMEITLFRYENGFVEIDLLPLLSDANSNGWKDLDDLENAPITGITPPPDGSYFVYMNFRFIDADGLGYVMNDYQGDTVVSTFTFTLNQ